jgi:hypothetical protein
MTPLSSGTTFVWGVLGLIGCWLGSQMIADKVEHLLIGIQVPPDIAKSIGFSFFVPGCIFLLLWTVVFPMVWFDKQSGVDRSEKQHVGDVFFAVIALWIVAGLCLNSCWQFPFWQFSARLAYTISVVMMTTITSAEYVMFLRQGSKNDLKE